MTQKIEISSRTIIFTVVFIILLRVVWLTRELFYALFFAFIFMSALKPAVNLFEKGKLPRFLAVFIVFVAAILSILFITGFFLPPLATESISFFKNLPFLISEAFPILPNFANSDAISPFLPDLTEGAVKFIGGVFSNLIFLISILFFTFYFLLEEKFLKDFLDRFFEKAKSAIVVDLVGQAERRMGAWVWGELVLMTIIGAMTYIGLSILQVPYALPLAVLAGLLEIIPIIGPTISAIPAFFVATSVSLFLGTATIALYIIIQQLENNIFVPFVMKKAVGLNPIITLIALTIGGKLGGLVGIILSVPAALFIETIIIELSRTKS